MEKHTTEQLKELLSRATKKLEYPYANEEEAQRRSEYAMQLYSLAPTLAAEVLALRDREKVLVAGLEKYIYSCSCHCGGFAGGEFVKQPCDRCDPLITLLGERAALMTEADKKEG